MVTIAGDSCAMCYDVYIEDHQSMSNYQKNKILAHASCVTVYFNYGTDAKHCGLGIPSQSILYGRFE